MRIRLQIAVLALVACQSNSTLKGQVIGTFSFSATPVSSDCSFTAVPPLDADGGFTFDGKLSHDATSTQAYFIVGNVGRDAGFDGQIFVSEASAPRHFVECNCDSVPIDETLRLVLLSVGQDDALGHSCPANPLDGGVPMVEPDAGPPLCPPTSDPCDVPRACGELIDLVVPDGGCQCNGCSMTFRVEGLRTSVP